MNYVYILRDRKQNKFYIGLTRDIERRLKEHRSGHNHTTIRFKDNELIFYEAFVSKEGAVRREKYFKTTKGKRALRLMLTDSLRMKEKQ